METIFDHNPTDRELRRFCIRNQKEIDQAKRWYADNPNDKGWQDSSNYKLGMLFAMRNDFDRANTYFGKIHDKSMLSTLIEDF